MKKYKKPIAAVLAVTAVLALLIGLSQIRSARRENVLSGTVYAAADRWADSGYTLARGQRAEAVAAEFASPETLTSESAPQDFTGPVAHLRAGDTLSFTVNAPEDGLYRIRAEYAVYKDSTMDCVLGLRQEGSYPYEEARSIVLAQLLTVGGYPFDRSKQGNEIAPEVSNEQLWQTRNFRTMSQCTTDYLLFHLQKGENRLEIEILEGEILLSRLLFDAPEEVPSYAEYRALHEGASGGNARIVIEAERMNWKNSTTPRPSAIRDIESVPFESSVRLMSCVGGDTWQTGGEALYYRINVEKEGWYSFAMKSKQAATSTSASNTFVHRSVSIDGELPFREAGSMVLKSSGGWEVNILGNEQEHFAFYLTPGEHILGVEVNASMLIPISDTVRVQNDRINALSLEIKKIIGNNTDTYRDWELETYIPDIRSILESVASELDAQADLLTEINLGQDRNQSVTSLRICARQLRTLAEDPDSIPNHMTMLSEGTGSVSQTLGELTESLLKQPISVDQIYLWQEGAELPDYSTTVAQRVGEEFRYFLSSFKEEKADEQREITVWVNRARNYVDLLQAMADSDFTEKTGIRVQLSVMPNEQKLVLSNTTGTQPDAALGVSTAIPYQLALRNALADLRQFEDFPEVGKRFAPGALIVLSHEDGVYALPETQDYYVLFYRKDLLEKLNLPVPETWNEVLELLPELQRYGMNFFAPLSMNSSFKNFYTTMPFIYQKGASLYAEDGASVTLNSAEGLEAIRFMTDLYTIYGLPSQVGDFYQQFRSGNLPLGVSSFSTFLKLDSAAAELAGKWGIALVPGFEDENGQVVHWSPGGGQTSIIFEKSDRKDEAWQFLEWWTSTETQTAYGQQIQMLYGDEYLWNTANLSAFAQMPIDEASKAVILEQMEWLYEVPQSPASYMVEREISNVWNKIVFDGENARSALDDAVILMNQELWRKLEEFGYMKDGVVVKPYRIPTIETVKAWLNGG